MPYTKPGNIPLYVNKESNHLHSIIENILKSINRGLSEILFDMDSLNKAAPLNQKALDDSGPYSHSHHVQHRLRTPQEGTATEILSRTTSLLERKLLLLLDGHFLRSWMKNSRRITRCIRTQTQLKSVTVAFPT